MLTSTVYTVASSDSCGLNTHIFITISAAYAWVAENAEGPSDDTRAELLQLVDQSDFAAFWDLLDQSTDDNGYAIRVSHASTTTQFFFDMNDFESQRAEKSARFRELAEKHENISTGRHFAAPPTA
jgi:hypothetical protein